MSRSSSRALANAKRAAIAGVRRALGPKLSRRLSTMRSADHRQFVDVSWMPAMQYARYWPLMDAFALPGYFDGRIRVNLRGREDRGRVSPDLYSATLDRLEDVLRTCVDIHTGEPVVREISRPGHNDPMELPDTQGDLAVLWNGSPIGFRHPVHGDIGPGPVRRSGGHSGGFGALYVRAKHIAAGDYGLRSSFDVAPSILDLMGIASRDRLDGETVFREARPVARIDKAVG